MSFRAEIWIRRFVHPNAVACDCDCAVCNLNAVFPNGFVSRNARPNLSRIAGQNDLRRAREDWI